MFLGLALIVVGQGVRTIAMCTCGSNFSHVVKEVNEDGHKLVTNGIYSILRHPAYFGWFYWSIGTQLFLCNPICTIFYTWVTHLSMYFMFSLLTSSRIHIGKLVLLFRSYPTRRIVITARVPHSIRRIHE